MILSICPFYFTVSFPLFPLINDSMFTMILRQMFWNYLARLTSCFGVQEWIRICESNVLNPESWTLDINWYTYRLSMGLIPPTTSLPWQGALIPQSNIIEWHWYKTHLYCSAQPSKFPHIVLNVDVSNFFKQSNKTFSVYCCSSRILFAIIWQKRMKHCMAWKCFFGWVHFCLW